MRSAALKHPGGPDPTYYPVEDDTGESFQHRLMAELLRPLVAAWLAQRGETAFVGADQFIYWQKHHPEKCVCPDVYVMPGVPSSALPEAWKLWEDGGVPSLAIEIVSGDVAKDYELGPRRYQELGVQELVVFDPAHDRGRDRVRWQVLRRSSEGLVVVRRTNADRVRSQVLGAWLRAVGEGADLRVRLGMPPRGEALFPTEVEREAELRRKAEAELGELRAELERRRRR